MTHGARARWSPRKHGSTYRPGSCPCLEGAGSGCGERLLHSLELVAPPRDPIEPRDVDPTGEGFRSEHPQSVSRPAPGPGEDALGTLRLAHESRPLPPPFEPGRHRGHAWEPSTRHTPREGSPVAPTSLGPSLPSGLAHCGRRCQGPARHRFHEARRVAVFVDGCFWHACPEHGTQPNVNGDYWLPKLQRNRERDRRVNDALTASPLRPGPATDTLPEPAADQSIHGAGSASQNGEVMTAGRTRTSPRSSGRHGCSGGGENAPSP